MNVNEDWASESNRAIDDHDPAREPYASMSRDEIIALMEHEGLSAYEYERLNQHLLDKCTEGELERINFSQSLAVFLMDSSEAKGNAQCVFISRLAAETTGELFDEMPPVGPLGPPHEVN